ncbi:hypothetical protein CCACVL1_18966 [Corchorus capsularis]|uniref:Uncharacterized protein n=1 Tax=Corchorus capsularis TaxID=210143 RepID=A0A1R3HJ34_COCAP|nr:hypothetical protein CCACVL1_18966 [Corchorus capsularis]
MEIKNRLNHGHAAAAFCKVRMIHHFKGSKEQWKAAKEPHKCLKVVEMIGFAADSTTTSLGRIRFKGSLEWKAAKESHKSLQVVEMVGFIAYSTAGDFLINLIHNTVSSLKKIIIDPAKYRAKDYGVEARKFAEEHLKMAPRVEVVIKQQ